VMLPRVKKKQDRKRTDKIINAVEGGEKEKKLKKES